MLDNMENKKKLTIGVDFGTDSCRALVINASTGKELAISTSYYKRWKNELYCNPIDNQYRHHPKDYIESLEEAIRGVLSKLSPILIKCIVAIGVDTTASTMAMTDKEGTPLALLPKYAENPNAMFFLWKDHTAIQEAEEINVLSRTWKPDYTLLSGGNYSLEWFWAKALYILRNDKGIYNEAYSAIELCDWIPSILSGIVKPKEVKRSRCAAGHKCMWAERWGGYPSRYFLSKLNVKLGKIRDHLSEETYTNDEKIGFLCDDWATKLGLSTDVIISTGIIDAHAAAIGAGIKPGTMVKIIGTSTCDIITTPESQLIDKEIPGISGQVDGSVLPGLIGIEAGQAAFGDVYAWFRDVLGWVIEAFDLGGEGKQKITDQILNSLTESARKIPIDDTSLVSLDWLNGRRTPFSDPMKKGIISGITLATKAPDIFKSLVEATAFGSKSILEHYKREGLDIIDIICVGGIPQKSPYVMQTLSDVLGVQIKVAKTEQAGALGAAMCAATAAKIFTSLEDAQDAMGSGIIRTYHPNRENHINYTALYQKYLDLGSI